MSQTTCCPSCGTKFKVVADQLRISDGWVRCGHCKEVFDATAHLQQAVDPKETLLPDFPLGEWPLPPSGPAPAAKEAVPGAPPAPAVLDVPVPPVPAFLAAPEPGPARAPGAGFPWPDSEALGHLAPAQAAPVEPLPPAPVEPAPDLDGYELPFAELRDEGVDAPLEAEDRTADGEAEAAPAEAPAVPDMPVEADLVAPAMVKASLLDDGEEGDDEELPEPQQEPGFVRAARRKAFWHSSGMRALLLLLGLGLAGTLAVQIALQERDRLAAAEPSLRPLLSMACDKLGCTLGPRKDIAAVVIDSSGFSKAARGDAYQLSLTLTNHAGMPVAMPAVELTLTDAQEQPVLRRVLLPAELGAPAELAGRGEWSGQVPVVLTGPALRLAGYRVLAFYP